MEVDDGVKMPPSILKKSVDKAKEKNPLKSPDKKKKKKKKQVESSSSSKSTEQRCGRSKTPQGCSSSVDTAASKTSSRPLSLSKGQKNKESTTSKASIS